MKNPDRVDLNQTPAGLVVAKFWKQDGREVPHPDGANVSTEYDLEAAVAWLQANGYTVRCWPGGARGWKGSPWPIRTRGQIARRRQEVEAMVRRGVLPQGFSFTSLDFALDM